MDIKKNISSIPRFMIAAPSSGSGKTLVTCGLLRLLQRRGLRPAAFKCGPDYIDPMFHRQVLGIPSRNLDTFFLPDGGVREVLAAGVRKHGAGLAVIEGVMGYFDGTGRSGMQASSFDLALQTRTPVILVVNAKGMSRSLLPLLKGFCEYEKKHAAAVAGKDAGGEASRIRGVILNRVSAGMFPMMKKWIEEETGLAALGCLPQSDDVTWGSRHLGLMQPEEISGLQRQIDRLADLLEKSLDLDALLEIAGASEKLQGRDEPADTAGAVEKLPDGQAPREAAESSAEEPDQAGPVEKLSDGQVPREAAESSEEKPAQTESTEKRPGMPSLIPSEKPLRIAVARDEAFSFYYEENFDLLRAQGAELVCFSPIRDRTLPQADGLILGGGYPELHAAALAQNEAVKDQIRDLAGAGIPILAECGGFMYLQDRLETGGSAYPMCGVLPGTCHMTDRLVRFGYVEIGANPEAEKGAEAALGSEAAEGGNPAASSGTGYLSPGHRIRAHEFHYFDSTDNGRACRAVKPAGSRSWECMVVRGNIMAGFPHLYYPSDPQFIVNFLRRCREWKH